jgi:hypothetical protein
MDGSEVVQIIKLYDTGERSDKPAQYTRTRVV